MEANETITPVLAGEYNAIQVQEMLANQAEVSFRTGYDKGRTVCPTNEVQGAIYLEGVQAGRKEVSDFLYDNSAAVMMNEHALEAKLKEWGLSPLQGERSRR